MVGVAKMPVMLWLLAAVFMLGAAVSLAQRTEHYEFFVKETTYKILCANKTMLTANDMLPGPTITARKGDIVVVNMHNQGPQNITIHWHGVDQPRNPWNDGLEFITQYPIQPGTNFTYEILLSAEEGTIRWHAHSGLDHADVHGAFIIHPEAGIDYPFIEYKHVQKEIPNVLAAPAQASSRVGRHYDFFVREANYTRLCREKTILTVNGEFPGPTIFAENGDVVFVNVYNQGNKNITLHWHGVDQPLNPWSDGPAYVNQCPIQPGNNFTYEIIFSWEEGTLWWHAHIDFDRATVYGAIVIHPKSGAAYPFPKPDKEIPIIFGEWWNRDVDQMLADALSTGSDFDPSDANTINGQPGDLFPCSSDTAFRLPVEHGKTYMLRIINAALANEFFFAIAGHRLTVVGTDAAYTKPLTVDHLFISPGQSKTVLLNADRGVGNSSNSTYRYYMAARAYSTLSQFDNITATAVLEYVDAPPAAVTRPEMPFLPASNDSVAVEAYSMQLRSLADDEHPVDVPRCVDHHMFITLAVNEIPCTRGKICEGPRNNSFAASLNNVSFESPSTDILGAYYRSMLDGVAKTDFPDKPAVVFNYTSEDLPLDLRFTARDTRVKVLEYGAVVEVVFQDTAILAAESHPMHLHGHSFYTVGRGLGNFDKHRDPATYNLVDPPFQNTVSIPKAGWAAIRFTANPGVWFMHCHFERHTVWGMETVFIVKDGMDRESKILPPPPNMPRC